jgi:hypothetical protein
MEIVGVEVARKRERGLADAVVHVTHYGSKIDDGVEPRTWREHPSVDGTQDGLFRRQPRFGLF